MTYNDRALWLSVLLVGLNDVANGRDPGWIYTRDFAAVCHLADVSADRVKLVLRIDPEKFRRVRVGN